MTAKLRLLYKMECPYLQESVEFLITRVKAPDNYYYKKLVRVMKYLRENPKLALTLEAGNIHVFTWWVDADFMCTHI